jgi:pimeloyl-ACP methyl ester carboxylesterase
MRYCAGMEVLHIPGPSHLAPLVFLHEGLGSVAMWQSRPGDWPAQLCQAVGRAGWVYSRRGYGKSPPIPDVRGSGRLGADYMHLEAWETLPALRHAWGIERPLLIGHSDGGTIALLHAARFAVAGCVVMAPHLMVEDMTLLAIQAAKKAYEEGDLRQKLSRYHDDVDSAFWQWNDVWLSQAFRSFDIRDECKAITAPILALQGEDDAYGSLRHLNELHTAGTVERHVLPNCGHSPHKDQAQKSLDLVIGFLKGFA